jgi:AcrR family transcriptional regulator
MTMMTNKHQPAPRSRRERPAKPALTRQGIIDVALAILRDEGLNKVTMRRIAEALDTGPASLYVYVRNTTDLHAQILDALLAAVTESLPVEGTWRERVKQVLTRYLLVLYKYPEIARMTLTTHLSGPNYLALLEHLLALLHEGGIADHETAWASDLLLLYATAVAAEHSTRESSSQATDSDQLFFTTITTADAVRYPHVARLGNELFSGSGMERFEWGIDMLLNGALNPLRAGTEQENV